MGQHRDHSTRPAFALGYESRSQRTFMVPRLIRRIRSIDPIVSANWWSLGFFLGAFVSILGVGGLHHEVFPLMYVPLFVCGAVTVTAFAAVFRSRPNRPRGALVPAYVLSLLALALGSLTLSNAIFGEDPHLHWRRQRVCADHLHAIDAMLQKYVEAHQGRFPDTLGDLVSAQPTMIGIAPLFTCTATKQTPSKASTLEQLASDIANDPKGPFVYVAKGLTSRAPADAVVMYERAGNHLGSSNVLYADGHVEQVSTPEFPALIDELQSGHNPPRAEMLK